MVDIARPFRAYEPFTPSDLNDVPRFGQLNETAKDVFLSELKRFFDYTTSDGLRKIREIPNIQKFAIGSSNNDVGLETVVRTIIAYADIRDKFPMICITSSSYRERKMGIGSNFACQVQYPASVVGRTTGPWNIQDLYGDLNLIIETNPKGITQRSTILFSKSLFANPSSISVDDVIRVINKTQALYYTMEKDSTGHLRISAGGLAAPIERNSINIVGGDPAILSLFGFQVGDSDTYTSTSNPVKNRSVVAADMTINIDVISDDLNTRVELSDLVFTFFTHYMDDKCFQFFGRSYFDRDLSPQEWFHISLNNQFSWSSESSKVRQGGELYEHIHAIRGSVPIFIEDFIDRGISGDPTWVGVDNVQASSGVFGDYGGENYNK